MKTMERVILSLGSNLGSRENNLRSAVREINERTGGLSGFSSVYETEPWGFEAAQDFLNMSLLMDTQYDPYALLSVFKRIEKDMGRTKRENVMTSRIIDIDILFYGQQIINTKELTVPHPRMAQRRFVLVPVSEIASEWNHPVYKKRISELLEECNDPSRIRCIIPADKIKEWI